MGYKTMIENARKKGAASEKVMYAGIERVDELLHAIKHEHPEEYERFMRETHQDIYGCHYDECFAETDIDGIDYTDKDGKHHHGAHWTRDEVVSATSSATPRY